jgi:hypothetical protein
MTQARLVYRTLTLLALLAGWSFVDSVNEHPLWSSCWRHECITQWEKDGLL